ncbi:GTPase IMAP family member 7-like [Mya arenaria]|uniref:GTPase IMAP family member 7-like n=1 Tax=Mya arenaria TaxID=6604 RepID=UPI0022E5BA3C|nr:GTPase IMAP family member 7-like [Mya arenaria]
MSDTILERRVILIGKTGCGKSSTGNTLLRTKNFSSKRGFKARTNECLVDIGNVEFGHLNYEYTVVDTPGFFDTETPLAKTALMIQSSATTYCPNPHAFLLVFTAGRFTHEDNYTVDMLRVIFGDKIWEHIIVVVTHGDDFISDEDLRTQVREHTTLSEIVKKCGNRLFRIENFATQTKPAPEKIFKAIELLCKNGTHRYSYAYKHCHEKELRDHISNYKGSKDIASQLEALKKNIGRWIPGWKSVCLGVAAGRARFLISTRAVAGAAAGATAWVTTNAATVATSVGGALSGALKNFKSR